MLLATGLNVVGLVGVVGGNIPGAPWLLLMGVVLSADPWLRQISGHGWWGLLRSGKARRVGG
ncbi:hypothetical protein SAMN02745129_4584 [Ferrimonas marina]|uniref:Uncharacterized protein n=2 Tax=Ferrimonas marina TaxID=299255 RepID=A0A1M5Z4N3_9GAMM|nr:hypothetical protein SAMN02745129_4584 [Ferrimonas marina]